MDGQDLDEQQENRVLMLPRESIQPDPGIQLSMQSLSIQDPEVLHIQAEQSKENHEQDARYNIFMKLAVTGGSARVLSLQAVQQSMSRAWRDNYHGISQLSRYIFVAHFRSLEAAMFVITRQPWSMGSDNFLLEWMDPDEQSRNIQDYKFDAIFVTLRVYGVPMRFRSPELLNKILQSVGQISEFHPFSQAMLHAKTDYMWGTIKAKVNVPVRDKIWVSFDKDLHAWVYLFYERIGRICTFCGVMFHSVQHCPTRNNLLISKHRLQISLDQIPSVRFGQWMVNMDLIPQQSLSDMQKEFDSFSTFQNPQLARLQKLFLQNSPTRFKMQVQGDSSVRVHKENNKLIQNVLQAAQGQSGAAVNSVGVSLTAPTEINEDLQDKRCNYTGGSTVQLCTAPAHQSVILSVLAQKESTSQSVPLSHSLLNPPCMPAKESNILGQQFGLDMGLQLSQPSQMSLGQSSTSTLPLPVIPLSSVLDSTRQHEPANSATQFTQSICATAISSAMEDKSPNEKGQFIPLSIHNASPSSSHHLPPSSPKFSPKRPSTSLAGLTMPPPKRIGVLGNGGSDQEQVGSGAVVHPVGRCPRSSGHGFDGSGVLEAPPSGPLMLRPTAPSRHLGTATSASAGPVSRAPTRVTSLSAGNKLVSSRSVAVKGGRGRFGPSKWETSSFGGAGGIRPNLSGFTCHRTGSASWHRVSYASQMGNSTLMCGSSSKSLASMDFQTASE
ncbi:uncharacterized protein LOC125534377 [Triticum urartu]|uniref:uncharacterized protein LOC125534377 n=1 Tax=Triticum urartu TaxID=4572 RepID=UPI00204340B2|nr:uncharacterized protein LOC125534377 [Triticum urartu]